MTRTPIAELASSHDCTVCGHSSPRWFGRCPSCGEWSSAAQRSAGAETPRVTTLAASGPAAPRLPTGNADVDRVLGGGLVPGGVCLLAGEPGIGKSTLVLQVLQGLSAAGRACLLVTGEETLAQTAARAARLGAGLERLRAAEATSLQAVTAAADAERPEVVVVDSIQTLENTALDQAAGSTVQVRECAAGLVRYAKGTGTAVIVVGHVTKDGAVAGPKTLEHVVDSVLTLEGERSGSLRLLRAVKNRFGSCDEVGVFTMSARGLEAVQDPSALLLEDRDPRATGSIVFCRVDGSRPVLVELQALVSSTTLAQPRRVAIGLDARRLALLLGVLTNAGKLPFGDKDVFAAAAGGLAVRDPGADLALCLALHSALTGAAIGEDVVAIGEVGLAGEVRRVPSIERRLSEAARLGFRTALLPRRSSASCRGIETVGVVDVSEALRAVFGPRAPR